MKAAALNQFGGPNELVMTDIPVPKIGKNEVLIQLNFAGVGQWDIFEREGGYNDMLEMHATFPYVLGSEGSGVVVKTGSNVKNFVVGDKVYATGFLNPKGGFYAEYAAVSEALVSTVPAELSMEEAGAISGVGLTALRGLEDVLELQKNESILIFGASGGVGHLAVQLVQQMGARVFAIASGEAGVAMVKKLGIQNVVDGRKEDVLTHAQNFAPEGFDAALFIAGGELANGLISSIRPGGRIAYPNGVFPIPEAHSDVKVSSYNGEPDQEALKRLSNRIQSGNLTVHVDEIFPLAKAEKAHQALNRHYIGKLALKIK